jgi:hypothetical protein
VKGIVHIQQERDLRVHDGGDLLHFRLGVFVNRPNCSKERFKDCGYFASCCCASIRSVHMDGSWILAEETKQKTKRRRAGGLDMNGKIS